MTYNVLSSSYATPTMYGYCPREYLDWQVRGQNVMSEIYQYNNDIICLQEVEMEQFDCFFLPNLQNMGYEGVFAPKSRASTMSEPKRRLVDGCAIFWKINKLAAAWTHGPPVDPNNIEQLVVVANTHTYWDPKFPDKTIQSMMLTKEIISMVENVRRSFNCHERILKFSDVKVLPLRVFQFLSTGQLPLIHPEFQGFNYINAIVNMMGGECCGKITHPLNLSSACSPQIMPYTNHTYGFKAMIDYIFYSSSNLMCLGVTAPFRKNGSICLV
ncbi:hypothetical protein KQX54_007241 [Cotesia glomerata]|uniref:Endonuclease/exonuclease/phosphatase domain-containing protein n=1 Tax=Cotesia glomerata TaxID=32391 RepID=A0AAV7HU91_COTGL|nr:hypothetical protein KQX54_007241 [Cotesia glomerata]